MAAIMLAFAPVPSAEADVVNVSGGAFGFSASMSLFGGPPSPRGPTPVVTLPPTGAEQPLTASEPSGHAVFGPVDMVDSGPMKVTTAGTIGPRGSVTSSSSVVGNYQPDRGPLRFELAESTCTASEEGVTGVTTMTRAFVQTKLDPQTEAPLATETIPRTPEPNYTVEGTLDNLGERFKFVFNEQILSDDGSITVNAIHMYALGPIAVGELVQAQSRCGAVGPGGPTTPKVLAAPTMPGPVATKPPQRTGSSAATDSRWLRWAIGGSVVVAAGAIGARWRRRRRVSLPEDPGGTDSLSQRRP